MRTAIVTGGADSLEQLQRYLPSNYQATTFYVTPTPSKAAVEESRKSGRKIDMRGGYVFVITGQDNAGWTLDEYVIPRLASGLIFAEEVGV